MSKIPTYERFFMGRIALGLEGSGYHITQEDIELLLSERIEEDIDFSLKIKNALTSSYSKDLEDFKKKLVTSDPSSAWEESVIKLYKGRETVLRDIVVEWYSAYKKPGFWDLVKGLFKR
jgi:hypothetical protein